MPERAGELLESLEAARPEDYADRAGYDPDFLGPGLRVELPVKQVDPDDELEFEDWDGETRRELRYTHFSVAMSVSRRLCLWSAVNIDGETSARRTSDPDTPRVDFRRDPRIQPESQTLPSRDPALDVYGNSPRFARGHITRREDPIWGDDAVIRTLGNEDSMHYTNVAPQMQTFNGKVWLALEDHALDNARADLVRISVMTGPIFTDRDPPRYGTQIPVEFWKVIAFIHDETGELSATAYTLSQQNDLVPELLFDDFEGAEQKPLSTIEERTGLSFGALKAHDALHGEESLAQPLETLAQVRFY
jgi:endonuclease G, mitochondrial